MLGGHKGGIDANARGRRGRQGRKADADYNCTFFFFNDTATTEIYTLSLHDALPICQICLVLARSLVDCQIGTPGAQVDREIVFRACLNRSEEHTSELQSH